MDLIKKYGEDNIKLFGPYNFKNLSEVERFVADMRVYSFDAVITSAGTFSENDDFNRFDINDLERTR